MATPTSTRLHLDGDPTLYEFIRFKTKHGAINIIDEIGTHYRVFGILLLEDRTGAIVTAIEHQYHQCAPDINVEVLKRWLSGQGKQPATWGTLVEVLKSIQLNVLARDIEDSLLQGQRELSPKTFEADYAEALKLGEVPAAYARVMFLGPGGSGKSSLLDGLMNQPLRPDESTALADTVDITYRWVEAAGRAEDAWKAVTDEDEDDEMASLVVRSRSQGTAASIKNWAKASAVLLFTPVAAVAGTLNALNTDHKYAQSAAQIHDDVTQSVVDKAFKRSPSSSPEAMMRIWDCGGQPIFLDILSAFLTQRTMFLLLFDASTPLNKKCQENWRHAGQTYPGRELNITILRLMMQWMQLIHASLVAKNESVTAAKEANQGEATMERRQSHFLPKCPRIMIVGSRGDGVQSKEKVLEEIVSLCKGKAFHNLVVDELIIDNTTAGKGRREDPGYRRIRMKIHEFTQSLTTQTPITWVSFRKVLQKTVVDTPVLPYEQVVAIAEECNIPKSVVPSVLHFYHQLGVFLHYSSIKSLSTTVIAEPQWLIKQLCKLFMPEWYCPKPRQLWQCLVEKGVLQEPLYQHIWGDCGLRGGAQALADLLDHFDLAKKISSVPREMKHYSGYKYFVPCMLKARSQESPVEEKKWQNQEAIQKAVTLHIVFNTGCIPPGFFVRLAACMTKSEKCTPIFERGIYRDSITFSFGKVDRVTISESKSLVSVQVDFIRVAESEIYFADSCCTFRRELSVSCEEAMYWLPSIEHDFAFECSCSESTGENFALINDKTDRGSQVFCRQDRLYKMDSEHKYWLPSAPLTMEGHVEDRKPTKTEIENLARKTKGNDSGLRDGSTMLLKGDMQSTPPTYGKDTLPEQVSQASVNSLDQHMTKKEQFQKPQPKLESLPPDSTTSAGHCRHHHTSTTQLLQGHSSLKRSPLKDVINALHDAKFAAADWEQLGIQLEQKQQQLANIKANNPHSVQSSLQEMINQWMISDASASWEKLAGALGRIPSYGDATANRLRQAVGLPSEKALQDDEKNKDEMQREKTVSEKEANQDSTTAKEDSNLLEQTPGEYQKGKDEELRRRTGTGANRDQEESVGTPPSPPPHPPSHSFGTNTVLFGIIIFLVIVLIFNVLQK